MKHQYPVRVGSLKRSPCQVLAMKIAKEMAYYNRPTLVITADHLGAVHIELPGQEVPGEMVGVYDTCRHWLDLARQLDGDLDARKKEIVAQHGS